MGLKYKQKLEVHGATFAFAKQYVCGTHHADF